jgi:signal transduction histidine kinase
MRSTLTRLRQSHGWLLDSSQMTSGPLAWAIIELLVAAFLLPYFLFPHLCANGVAYGTLSLVPLYLAAYLRAHRGVVITWGTLVLGFSCSFWLSYGLSGPSGAIANNTFGYAAELPMGLAGAQFIRMHRQIIANRLVSQEQEQQIAHQQQVSELKDLLIMNLSHELRTPLTGLYGYLELLGNYDQQLDEAMRTTFLTHARKEVAFVSCCPPLLPLLSLLKETS